MKRRALIIYCGNTSSGRLAGPVQDVLNYRNFLGSMLGGDWMENEIEILKDPSSGLVKRTVNTFQKGAGYTFTVFTGHGFINVAEKGRQYIELSDTCIPIRSLITDSRRQTMVFDACRGFYRPTRERIEEYAAISGIEHLEEASTRRIFDNAVMKADEGLSIMYAANVNESALDTNKGGAYLFSLLAYTEIWKAVNKKAHILPLNLAHTRGKALMYKKFNTIQRPVMNKEKRVRHFPFAAMYPLNF